MTEEDRKKISSNLDNYYDGVPPHVYDMSDQVLDKAIEEEKAKQHLNVEISI